MKKKVGVRLLQIILSHESGDRITAAVLHWDGEHLRVASSLAGLVMLEPEERDGFRVAILAIVGEAEKVARRIEETPGPRPEMGLAEVFPVREGLGASLYWTPVSTLRTSDPAAHFEGLVRELHLERCPQAAA
ncbi:MAG TPA: hypothetical protein VMP89_20715 [Solirubrobacteraceae bacterium]|nr:hypothetical protein [Solirubrobacteraceae bacterium]